MIDSNKTLNETRDHMQKAIEHLEAELTKVRAGRAIPSKVAKVSVDYYGTAMPLNQVSNVSILDARTIMIQPWEKSMLTPIEKAIQAANLGFNPQNDGVIIRIVVPPLTEERRKDLTKTARSLGKDANENVKKLQKTGLPEDEAKGAETKIQQLTDGSVSKVDAHIQQKEKEIM